MTTLTQIQVGTSPNDGSGDTIRDAFIKVNDNTNVLTQLLYVDPQFATANITSFLRAPLANLTTINANTINTTGNINSSGMIYVGGVPVATSLQAFNGGTVPGAVTFDGPVTINAGISLGSYDLTLAGNVNITNGNIGNLVVANITVGTGGGIDNTPIGQTNPAAGKFTTLQGTNFSVTNISAISSSISVASPTVFASSVTAASLSAGDVTIVGNLSVTGTQTINNVQSIIIKDPVIEMGTGTDGSNLVSDDQLPRGLSMHYYDTVATSDRFTFLGWNTSNKKLTYLSPATFDSGTNTYTGVLGDVEFGTIQGTIGTAAQPSITSLGTLTGLTVGGPIIPTANVTVDLGNTANHFRFIYGTASRANTFLGKGGTYLTAGEFLNNSALTGITTLVTGNASGNVTVANLTANGSVTATSIIANSISIGGTGGGGLDGITIGSSTPSPGYFTILRSNSSQVWTEASLTNLNQLTNGPGYLTSSTGVTGFNSRNGAVSLTSSDVTNALTYTPANRSGDTFTGPVIMGVASSTTFTVGNISNANSSGVGNIGSSTTPFNTVFATATSAVYADLAEIYTSDRYYEPGTLLKFGGDKEVTESTITHNNALAGVVSTNPSYVMNSQCESEFTATVALVGRVPTKVIGKIVKGSLMTSSDIPGVATAVNERYYKPGCIIGRALENYDSDQIGVIEVVMGRS
jgi:hypothetical protein